jgi:hypothetical protein
MTQAHLDIKSYEIPEEEKILINAQCDEPSLNDYTYDNQDRKQPTNSYDSNQNLIRKVEMKLDSDTDIHIYENKFKVIVKKQTPFYVSKKTWKLLISKYKTINTVSKLTEM